MFTLRIVQLPSDDQVLHSCCQHRAGAVQCQHGHHLMTCTFCNKAHLLMTELVLMRLLLHLLTQTSDTYKLKPEEA